MCYVNYEVRPVLKKSLMILAAVLVLAVAYVRPVYSVELDGAELSGSWDRAVIERASELARMAGEEIARGESETPEPECTLHFSILPATGELGELTGALLAASPGVQRAWRVTVDGVDIGTVSDVSAFDELLLTYVAELTPPDSVSVSLTNSVALDKVFIPTGYADAASDVSTRLRSLVSVSYLTDSGERIYA